MFKASGQFRIFLKILVILLILTSCVEDNKQKKEEDKKNEARQIEAFFPTVKSLQNYTCPEWFRDAKLGIYMHWGPYSVAEQGEWYARKLYLEDTKEYEHHVNTYGHPSQFGYKDFIPMWKAENFNPDALVALFKKAGAKYFTPCAVHHDNFDLWNSKHHKWNAVNMGPKKDLIGMFREATLKHGLRFGVTTHLSRSYSWLNTANLSDTKGSKKGVPYDGADGEGRGLYPPKHDDIHQRAPINPPKEWRDLWAKRIKDLIDNYHPDHLYFDCAVPFRGDDMGQTGMDVIAHLYNHSMKTHNGKQEAVMCVKERPWQGLYADGITTLDYERGKSNEIRSNPWQTDDSIGPWGYRKDAEYMTPNAVIDKFIDIVSKNGNLLLNVPIKADGTLDVETINVLEQVGEWMDLNGEAIYGSRPWYIFGEGPTNHMGHYAKKSPYGKRDIRFTTNQGNLFIFVLDWPGNGEEIIVENITLTNTRIKPVKNIKMLGTNEVIKWKQHPDGLKITMPDKQIGNHAYTFKVIF